jgi:hypothetical protein
MKGQLPSPDENESPSATYRPETVTFELGLGLAEFGELELDRPALEQAALSSMTNTPPVPMRHDHRKNCFDVNRTTSFKSIVTAPLLRDCPHKYNTSRGISESDIT